MSLNLISSDCSKNVLTIPACCDWVWCHHCCCFPPSSCCKPGALFDHSAPRKQVLQAESSPSGFCAGNLVCSQILGFPRLTTCVFQSVDLSTLASTHYNCCVAQLHASIFGPSCHLVCPDAFPAPSDGRPKWSPSGSLFCQLQAPDNDQVQWTRTARWIVDASPRAWRTQIKGMQKFSTWQVDGCCILCLPTTYHTSIK
jgi:hypothetical protein